MIAPLRRTGEALLSLIFPPHCENCGGQIDKPVALCPSCAADLPQINAPFCHTCSQPFHGEISGEFSCANCQDRHFHFSCAIAPFRSRGPVRELVHRFKYQNQLHLRRALGEWLEVGLQDERLQNPGIDALVPVPLHATRRRMRGFNQAEVLARILSERTGLPTRNLLQRVRNTTTQTRLDRAERMENLRDAFRLTQNAPVTSQHLVLVDDVLTTGSTLDECARVLRAAGAASVRALVVARG